MPAAEPASLLISDAEIDELRELMLAEPVPPRRKYASGADMALDAIAKLTGTSRQSIKSTQERALQRLAAVAALRLGHAPIDAEDIVTAFMSGPATKEELRVVRNPDRRNQLIGAKPSRIAVSKAFSMTPRPIDSGHGWNPRWEWRPRAARQAA